MLEGRTDILAVTRLGLSGNATTNGTHAMDGVSQETKSGITATIQSLTAAEPELSNLEFYRRPDEGSWHTDEQYLSILPGLDIGSHRDTEKHELLEQLYDPDSGLGQETACIVASAQLALCIQYAREICLAITGLMGHSGTISS